MDWTLEVVVVPVTDVDRSKRFYTEQLGFNVDADLMSGPMRVVQLDAARLRWHRACSSCGVEARLPEAATEDFMRTNKWARLIAESWPFVLNEDGYREQCSKVVRPPAG